MIIFILFDKMAEAEKLQSTKYWINTDESNFNTKIRELLKNKSDCIAYIYGKHDPDGRSWCPDCEAAQPFVNNILPKIKENESEKEVYFLNIGVDKTKKDIYKNDKILKMTRVPTLIYFSKGTEMDRLIEGDLASQENLDSFIDQIYEDL